MLLLVFFGIAACYGWKVALCFLLPLLGVQAVATVSGGRG